MRRLVLKGALLILLNVCLGILVLWVHGSRLRYERWETDSILLSMPEGVEVDLVILGSSHAYVLSRFKDNHTILERELGMRTINMALPTGGGVRPARYFLEYFFEVGNTTPRLLYVLDPFVFYSSGSNDAHKFVYTEPLDFSFLKKLVLDGYPAKRIFTYVRTKFTYAWLFQYAKPLGGHYMTVDAGTVDDAAIAGRIGSLYPDGMEEETFLRYGAQFEKILAFCRARNVSVYVVIPPTMLGPEPGASRTLAWLVSLQSSYDFEIHDMASVLEGPDYYYNLDHLNTAGVERFVGEYLAPIFAQGDDAA